MTDSIILTIEKDEKRTTGQEKEISEILYIRIRSTGGQPARFDLAKVHKVDLPLRSILCLLEKSFNNLNRTLTRFFKSSSIETISIRWQTNFSQMTDESQKVLIWSPLKTQLLLM